MSDTVFMIHGMWTGGWIWDNYKNFFEKRGFKCLTPNLRFHNLDSKDTPDARLGTTSLLDYANDLEQEINKLGEKPIIIGHSMGGLLAQILGSRGLAKALILLSPALPAGILDLTEMVPDPDAIPKGFQSILSNPNWFKEPLKPNFDDAVYLELHLLSSEEQKTIYNQFVHESGLATFEINAWKLDPNKSASVDANKITCPVLVIAASEDNCLPPPLIKMVADYYKEVSTYKEFEKHAHWLIGEPGWEGIVEYVLEWINKII